MFVPLIINIRINMSSRPGYSSTNKQPPITMNINNRPRQVLVKREESFIKGYSSIHTFFESKEFMSILK